jgi:anti-anti-sigma factor
MKYALEKQGGVVVISLKSSLEGGPDTFKIKDDVKAELGKGERRFLLNMKNAGFVNSTGIGVIMAVLSSIRDAEGTLKVCGVSDRARRAFVTTGVWQLFDVEDDCEEALKGLTS